MCLFLLENMKSSVVIIIDCFRVLILKTFDGFIDVFILLQAQTVQSLTGQGGGEGLQGGVFVCLPCTFRWLTFLPATGCLGAQLGAGWSNWGCGNFPLI